MQPNPEKPAPQQVVVAYDFSPPAEIALARAIEIACRAPWHVLHVVAAIDDAHPLRTPLEGKVDYHHAERVQELLKEKIAIAFAAREALSEVHFFVHARIGKAADEILDLAEQVGADLIVMGSHGHTGVSRLLFGSVSEKVVRHAKCPVMVARPKGYDTVELQPVVEAKAEEHHRYVRPHRYSYTDGRVLTRPDAWPLA